MKKNPNEMSIEELEKLLAKKKANKAPAPLDTPDIDRVVRAAAECIYDLENGFGADAHPDHWMFEIVMEAVYGPKIWDWINERL